MTERQAPRFHKAVFNKMRTACQDGAAPSLTLILTPAPQRAYCCGNLGELDRASCLQVQYNGSAGGGLAGKLRKLKPIILCMRKNESLNITPRARLEPAKGGGNTR